MRVIIVELGKRSYPIHINKGLLSEIGPRLVGLGFKGKAAIVTNPTVGELYAKRVTRGLEDAGLKTSVITVPDGEGYKTLSVASTIYDSLIEHRMERSDPIIALGGGVIGDMAGFAAATYLRGVPYIQAPTTLLSQVDSSVGGKTGVNHPKGKNLIGAFYQPKAVFIDPDALTTLEEREVRAGLAEVVKYGVIRDKEFFKFLEKNSDALLNLGEELTGAIERSCEIKGEVVAADETETGLRSMLNFGHTFGHAIESLTGYGTFKHGEAVSMGMSLASDLSVRLGLCRDITAERIKELLQSLGLPVAPPELSPNAMIDSIQLDKKVAGGMLRLVLVNDIGSVSVKEVEKDELKAFLSR